METNNVKMGRKRKREKEKKMERKKERKKENRKQGKKEKNRKKNKYMYKQNKDETKSVRIFKVFITTYIVVHGSTRSDIK